MQCRSPDAMNLSGIIMQIAKLSEKGRYHYGFTGVAKRKLTSLRLEMFASIFNEVNLEMS